MPAAWTMLTGLMAAGLALGVFAQEADPPHGAVWSSPNRFDRPVLRLNLSARTRLIYQPAEQRPWGQYPGLAPEPQQPALGVEFKSSKPGSGLRQVLRVQLSSQESLQFRPRKGGMAVTYRAQF
ncbi:MAG TPA: hypothetical protein VM845_07865 [Burkholderiaceae bacterium]|jgi:hypothetical protein|nr:hypothetical protein [Burkholderiaceae bacterium]